MNPEKILNSREDFDAAGLKFREYLDLFGGPDNLSERIEKIHLYLTENNLKMLALTFKQAQPLVTSILGREPGLQDTDHVNLVMKALLVFLDVMNYSGYIKESFLPDELKIENSPKVIIKVPQEMIKKVKRDKKNKKNGKK